jgi:hypothetical protein
MGVNTSFYNHSRQILAMTRKQQIEKEIEAVMGSLDHLSPASPAPFFYTRLHSRMMKEEKNVWGLLSRAVTRPAIAGFSVVFIIAINIFAVMHHRDLSGTTAVSDQAYLAVADEYSRANSFYIIDNVQP